MTPKQAMFVAEYLVDFNQTRAAMAVGVPEKSAAVTASRWMKNRKVAAAIAERSARRLVKAEEAAEKLDGIVMAIACADPKRFYDENGERIPVHLLDAESRLAISVFEDEISGKTRTQRVKLADKLRAAELSYKRRGLLIERGEFDHRVKLEDLVSGRVENGKPGGSGSGEEDQRVA